MQEWAKSEIEEQDVAEEDAMTYTYMHHGEKTPTIKWIQKQQREEIPSISNHVCNLKKYSGQDIR